MQKYETIWLDSDGVITDTIKAICDLYNDDFQLYKNFKKVDWWTINTWGFEELTCADRDYINKYFNQPRFFKILQFMPWAERIINELTEHYTVKIVSMGYSPNLKGKELFFQKKFPQIEFVGVNFREYKDKSNIDMSDSIFIDDSCNNLETSNAAEKICFGDVYSWNEQWTGKRLANWMDVKKYLL